MKDVYTPPTNEPKMPEVLMVEPETFNACEVEDFQRECTRTNMSKWKPYHHDDKVQELRESLRECVEAFNANKVAILSIFSTSSNSEELCSIADKITNQALTKASNLLK